MPDRLLVIETPPDKRKALDELLDAGPAMIHLDPRRDGVLAPSDVCEGPVLRLKLSWRYAHPLHIDDEGVVQTLTFPSGSFRCAVPWDAIFAMGPADSPPSWVWPSALPREMRELLASAVLPDTEEVDVPEDGPAPLALLAAQPDEFDEFDDPFFDGDGSAGGEGEGEDDSEDDGHDDPPGTIRRGHLRLVK